jgi:virulence factor Mce-like protein
MRRAGTASIVANPVLVGAVTVLVIVVAVFLAYNANSGLPFVPTREYKVELPSGSNLVKGNDVRAGGFRIGVVKELRAVTRPDGATVAIATLKLDRSTGTVPSDSTVRVRPRSALGLKYVELTKGRSERNFVEGDTIPLGQTSAQVELDDLNKLFDARTRHAAQRNLAGFGDAFAGRGLALNTAIERLPGFLGDLEPVAANLADPRTRLGRLFRELGDAARIVAPVAQVNARLFTDMATTFEAISRDPGALQDTISKSPPTLDTGTRSLRVQRPFLEHTADFSRDLRLATRELRAALPDLNAAITTGTPVLRRTVTTSRDLERVLAALRDLVRAPGTNTALRGLVATVTTLNPQLRFLGPYQTVCNYWNYFWTSTAEHFSEADPTGGAERVLLNSSAGQTNSLMSAGAYEPANGVGYDNLTPVQKSFGDQEFLQGQNGAAAVTSDGRADCENGQRGFVRKAAVFGPPNDLAGNPFLVAVDPHTPGVQGPTWTGRARVPRGQTFVRDNQTGATYPPAQTTGIYGP